MNASEQIEQRVILTASGNAAVCVDPKHEHNGWVLVMHDGHWVTSRPALPNEIQTAQRKLEALEVAAGIPCKG